MKSDKPMLSRRAFLRGAGGVAIALPFLEAMGCSRDGSLPVSGPGGAPAGADRLGRSAYALSGAPKRLVLWFTANGVNQSKWWPTGTETNFSLSPALSPLEPFKQQLLITEGVDMASYNGDNSVPPGPTGPDHHQKGFTHLLTCKAPANGMGGGPSFDQVIAKQIGTQTKFPSLQFGIQTTFGGNWPMLVYMVYEDAQKPLPAENDSQKMFTRLFANLSSNPADTAKIVAQRKSVLDTVLRQTQQLHDRLGASDRGLLESHMDAIRDIERRLALGGGASCQKPNAPAPTKDYRMAGTTQMDLLAMSLGCDLTRVASIQWSSAKSYVNHTWLGSNSTHHHMAHQMSDAGAQDIIFKINQWSAQQLAYFAGKLAAMPDPAGGTVLDNTAILWVSEHGTGNHSPNNMAFVILGGAGKSLRTGRFVQYSPHISHTDFYIGLMQALGVQAPSFGDPKYATGASPRLT